MGPKWGPVRFEFGADYLWTDYTIPNGYTGTYSSVMTPARAVLDIKIAKLDIAAGPIFFMGTDRKSVKWTDKNVELFGDEFFYGLSAVVGLGPIGVGLSYQSRITNYGNDNTVGVGVGI